MFLIIPNLFFSCTTESKKSLNAILEKEAYREMVINNFYKLNEDKEKLISSDTLIYIYDKRNRLISENQSYFYQYDSLNRLERKFLLSNDKIYQWKYIYFSDTLLKRIDYQTDKDSIFLWQSFEYDSQNNLVEEVYYKPADSVHIAGFHLYGYKDKLKTELWKYTSASEKNRIDSMQVFYRYNAQGKLSREIFKVNNYTSYTNQKEYIYNNQQQVTLIKTSAIMPINASINDFLYDKCKISYDKEGRKVQVVCYLTTRGYDIPFSKTQYIYKKIPEL